MEPPCGGRTKVYSNGPGHMTKMAAMPIYDENMKKIFSKTKTPMTLKVCMQHWVLEYYQVCSNDDPWLTFTYFSARSNLVPYAFIWEKVKTMDFSETIVVCDIKVGRCSQQSEYIKLYESQWTRSLIDFGPNLLDSIFLNFFFSITTRLIEAKFHMEPLWDGRMKAHSTGPGHMIKMATMPIYGKNHLKIFFFAIKRSMTLKLGIQH